MIELEHITKTYKVAQRNAGLGNAFKSYFKREYKEVKALNDISFKINEGEMVGYIGPNGAGKSKLGPFYSSVKAFDGDQLAMKLRKEHPDWKDSWVEGTVISTLMKEKDEAILLKKNYAFETNFSSDLPINLIKDFKNANYKICLIYFGLSHIVDSSTRVDQRYILGGHNVNQDVIEYNFTEGIKRVRASLPLFENILFIDGTSDFGDIVAIHIEKSGKHQITDHPAEWFDKYFKEAFDALVDGEEE